MGKKSRKSKARKRAREKAKRERQQREQNDVSDEEEEEDLLAAAAAWADQAASSEAAAPSKKQQRRITRRTHNSARTPPPFPPNMFALPQSDFLRDEEPYRKAFQAAMDTAYEGYVWDQPSMIFSQQQDEQEIRRALTIMDESGLFRADVTQPAGLGTKCSKTYVTRCLLGEEGTTYKYLGLRMFSHPWNTNEKGYYSPPLQAAIQTIFSLNEKLTERTKIHLKALEEKRLARNLTQPVVQGRAAFDVALINKMTVSSQLKEEPMFRHGKCSVSWHADSSLEHFSTIAVYHTLFPETADGKHKKNTSKNFISSGSCSTTSRQQQDWSIALRVTPNAEGPNAKRLSEISVIEDSPPVAVSLPSGSAYYLLDDHNHHHQHAVLVPSTTTAAHNDDDDNKMAVRFSSTHRLLRQGHNVEHILARCAAVCGSNNNFYARKGPKRWRSEQLLLNEIEFEWLRQFFVQGEQNKQLLWGYWGKKMAALLNYWSQLETRTRQVLLLLKHASEERCGLSNLSKSSTKNQAAAASCDVPTTQQERKLREKRRKALAAMEEILGQKQSPKEPIYDSLASVIMERASARELWSQREQDPVFKRMPPSSDCQPIPFPVIYNDDGSSTSSRKDDRRKAVVGRSPMPSGSPAFLSKLAEHVKAWGICYETRDAAGLPQEDLLLACSRNDNGGGADNNTQTEESRNNSQTEESTEQRPPSGLKRKKRKKKLRGSETVTKHKKRKNSSYTV